MRVFHSAREASDRFSFGLFIGIILIGANLRAPITSLGPILPDIQTALGLSGSAAGVLNSIPLLVFAILSLLAPWLGRKYGGARVLGASLLAIAAGTGVRSMPLDGVLWIGTLMLSAGIAFGNVLLPGLVKREFPQQAPVLIGMYAAAMATIAGIASGLAVPISRLSGFNWRWSIGIWAILALVTLIVWIPQLSSKGQSDAPVPPLVKPVVSVWRHAIGWQVSLFFALHSFVFYSVIDWFGSYAASVGIPASRAGTYLLVFQVVAVATNLGSASLIKRTHDQVALGFTCGLLLLIGSAGLLVAPSWSLLWLISNGLGAGIAMVTSLSLFALRTHHYQEAAELSGMAQFVGYSGAALGPLLFGIAHDATGGWISPLLMLTGCSALVIVFASLAGRRRFIE
jgi:CP family cyanate transporter-like MFS transporter